MKKYVIAALFALVAVSAQAGEYVGVSAGSLRSDSQPRSNIGAVTFGESLGSLSVEGRVAAVEVASTNALSNFVEARARYDFADLFGVKPWVRVTVGEQFVGQGQGQGGDRSYAGVEPGVGYQFTSALRGDVSVARTVTISHVANADQTAGTVGVTYALTSATSVGVSYAHVIGKVPGTVGQTGANSVVVGFSHSL